MRILLVEDDRLISSGLTLALKRAGHEVCAAETAKETQDAFGQRSFDLLILDLGLPDGSGARAAGASRAPAAAAAFHRGLKR